MENVKMERTKVIYVEKWNFLSAQISFNDPSDKNFTSKKKIKPF